MSRDIWAVVPVKEFLGAKQRLGGALGPAERQALAELMVSEVLQALAAARGLAGIIVVTVDPAAIRLAEGIGATIFAQGARDGHTGSVAAAQAMLAREGRGGMLTLPGDIPCVTAAEIEALVASHPPAPAFTIVPAHDDQGSNAILCSPPDAVTLRFGENSFFPHLDAARARGIEPNVMRLEGIGLDIDHPVDLARLFRSPLSAGTRTRDFLRAAGLEAMLQKG